MRKALGILAKLAITVFLLYLSMHSIDLRGIKEKLEAINFIWALFILLLLFSQALLLSLRWREIAATCGAKLDVSASFRYTLISLFFSQVLPSTVGGDAARIMLMGRVGGGWARSVYSVLIDRVVGLSTMAAIVVMCLPWSVQLIDNPPARAALALVGIGALMGMMFFLALGFLQFRLMERWHLIRHLAIASRAAWALCKSKAGARVAALSIASHILTVTVMWAAAKAIHSSVDFVHVLILVLPVLLIASVPVSIAGWGVRESAMVLAFTYAGLSQGDGLLISMIYGLASLALGVIGGIVWVAGGRQMPDENTAAI
jgi:uncharacterized protein (TIRG00374 family)